ncbi:hypothetical protein [Bacillus sp. Marseille-P3661]|uniref:hypothetical protein n=1 Tax=Bacillus sp. Marseille-P3661 TaxID=1936234 RepID=UPI000C844542|nr:hypothetical protein [Bacillus sp. Marseille-P3661]
MWTKIFKIFLLLTLFYILLSHSVFANERITANPTFPVSFKIQKLPWNEVKKIIPRYSKFRVIDLETGASFQVQRRAGSRHADVQPLTNKDTAIMKKIYNGKWSWNRRAVLVLVNDQLIAASMHGMPHGAGALVNNFPGHFCIHFHESTTHRSSQPDLGHHLMILRSGGELEHYLQNSSAEQMINIFMTALNNEDYKLLKAITYSNNAKKHKKDLHQLINNVDMIKWEIVMPQQKTQFALGTTIQVKIHMYTKKNGLQREQLDLELSRAFFKESWKVNISSLKKLR